MKRKSHGFTLIEILVVIAIMAILMSIIFGSITAARTKSRDNKRLSDVKEIQLALEQYFDANNAYPLSSSNTFTASNALAPYVNPLPTDPSSGAGYYYASDGNSYFCVGTTLEDPLPASIVDNANCEAGTSTYSVKNP